LDKVHPKKIKKLERSKKNHGKKEKDRMIGFICYDMIQWNPVGQLSIFVSYEKGNPSEGGIIKCCSTVNNSTSTKLTTAITVQFFPVKV
jgi:hypothetical protein